MTDENLGEWLHYQKSNWRNIRKLMKTEKKVIKEEGKYDNKARGLNQFIKNMDDVVLNSVWHIVQLQETSSLGSKVWVSTEAGNMFSVKLQIPRIVYINSKVISDNEQFKKVEQDPA